MRGKPHLGADADAFRRQQGESGSLYRVLPLGIPFLNLGVGW
jgi:hypothetical protein